MQKYKSEQERKRMVGEGGTVAVKNELEMCGSLNTLH